MAVARGRANDLLPVEALAIIVWNAITDLNFLTAPRDIATVAGRDSWLALIVGFALIALAAWIPVWVGQRFPGMTLVEIARVLLGRAIGSLVVVLYIGYWILAAAWPLRVQANMLMTTLLPETPGWVPNAYLVLVSTYLVLHGLEPMARMFLLLAPAFLAPLVVLMIPAFAEADFGRLLPVLEEGMSAVLHGAWITLAQGFGLPMVWMVLPHVQSLERARSAVLVGVGFVFVPALALMTVTLTVLGPAETAARIYPTLLLFELVEVPGFTGFRIDPIFLVLWLATSFSTVALLQYAAATAVRRLLGLGSIRWPVVLIGLALTVLGAWPVGQLDLLHAGRAWLPWAVSGAAFGVPSVLMVMAMLRRPAREGAR